MFCFLFFFIFFFFNDTATTEIYTLSLHDALPICSASLVHQPRVARSSQLWAGGRNPSRIVELTAAGGRRRRTPTRSEEHTSELQSQSNLVCRLLLEKKKKKMHNRVINKE